MSTWPPKAGMFSVKIDVCFVPIAPEPVKFPANIDLVVKNYDKINAAMPPVQ